MTAETTPALSKTVILERMYLAIAVVALGYCTYVAGDTWLFQHKEKLSLESRQEAIAEPSAASAAATDMDATDPLVGRIDVPRLGISVAVMEGAEDDTLRHSAGHIVGTALPGHPGNVGIAAHRDTFFRPLRNIRNDDVITLTTAGAEYQYRVVSTKVVSPDDVSVLESNGAGDEVLTLVTCYPFFYTGAAPSRFIVRAEKVPELVAAAKPSPFR